MDAKLEQVCANFVGKCLKFVSSFSAKMEIAEADVEKNNRLCSISVYGKKVLLKHEFYDVLRLAVGP